MKLLDFSDYDSLKNAHKKWVDSALNQTSKKVPAWTNSIAVGDKQFIEKTKERLGNKAKGRKKITSETGFELREDILPYGDCDHFDFDNTCYWNREFP